MILATQFLIDKTKEIDNPLINWGVGYTAEVMMEFAKLYHEQELKKLPIHFVIESLPLKEKEVCSKCQELAKHKRYLNEDNEQLRQRLIDAGLEKPAVVIDYSRSA